MASGFNLHYCFWLVYHSPDVSEAGQMDHAMTYGLILMMIGMALILIWWQSLYRQAEQPSFARKGIYNFSRHPQYLGFILLVLGWF